MNKSKINFLLVDLGSPHNIGTIIRANWVLGGDKTQLNIFDPRGRITENKEAIDLSSLTLVGKKGTYKIIKDLEKFLSSYKGRIIATDITKDAIPLGNFNFMENDLILFGNENRGYRDKDLKNYPGIEFINKRLLVPMLGKAFQLPDRGKVTPKEHGVYPNLNVASTFDIVAYTVLEKLGLFKDIDFQRLHKLK